MSIVPDGLLPLTCDNRGAGGIFFTTGDGQIIHVHGLGKCEYIVESVNHHKWLQSELALALEEIQRLQDIITLSDPESV